MKMYDSETFRREAMHFLDVSKSLNAMWKLGYYIEGDADSLYLCLKEEKTVRKIEETKYENEAGECSMMKDAAELNLSRIENDGRRSELLTFEYHVTFSLSYSVPTLYFKVHRSNGKALRLEEIWGIVPEV